MQIMGIFIYISSNKRQMNSNNQRVRIFENWDIKSIKIQHDDERRLSPNISYAEDLVNEALLLLFNIQTFASIKAQYIKKSSTFQEATTRILEELHHSCNNIQLVNENIKTNMQKYKVQLKHLYKTLRQIKMFQQNIQLYFKNANLANYDQNIMELKFTKSKQQLDEQLQNWTNSLRSSAYEVVNMVTLGSKQLSFIFTKEYTLDYQVQILSNKLAHDSLVKIHYIMIFQIQHFNSLFQAFKQNTRVVQMQYLKYEMICDCIKLMEGQSQQMDSQLQAMQNQIKEICKNPHQIDYKQYLITSNQKTKVWNSNIHIYETNLQNFTRVNVETDMYYYASLKASFIQKLDRYTQGLKSYKNDQQAISYLLQRYSLFRDLNKRVELTNKTNEIDKKFAHRLYNECSEYQIHKSHYSSNNDKIEEDPIIELKKTVVYQIHNFLSDKTIAYQKHLKSYPELQKSKAFFLQLHQTPVSSQYQFLHDQRKNINTYSYELKSQLIQLRQKLKDSRAKKDDQQQKQFMMQSYNLAMMYAIIAANSKTFKQKNQQFQTLYSEKGFENLPLNFQNIIFNYINDINTIIFAQQFLQSLTKDLQKFESQLAQRISKQKLLANMDSIIQQQLQSLNKIWLLFYHDYLSKLSKSGISLLSSYVNKFCFIIENAIYKCFIDKKLINPSNMNIDKNIFFTHRILKELHQIIKSNESKKNAFKMINKDSIIQLIYKYLDRSFLNLPIGGKISTIIKLSLLEEYFKTVEYQDHPQFWLNVCRLKYITYLQSISQLYPIMFEDQEIILSNLLQIHLEFHQVTSSLPFGRNQKTQLNEKTVSIVKQLFRYPLTIATKRNVIGFIYIYKYYLIVKELKAYQSIKLSILDVSKIYTHIFQMKQISKAVQMPYQSYENMLVKDKRQIVRYLQPLRKIFKLKMDQCQDLIEQLYSKYLNKNQSVNINRSIERLCKKLN